MKQQQHVINFEEDSEKKSESQMGLMGLIVFWCERRDLSCSHSNGDIFTCEDIKLSSKSSPGISLVFI